MNDWMILHRLIFTTFLVTWLIAAASTSVPCRADQPTASQTADEATTDPRPPRDDADLRRWLENMIWAHRFSTDEIVAATGLDAAQIAAACRRLEIHAGNAPAPPVGKLRVMPYPGGRHPRIGFLDGAVRPQRETKFSVFCPWDAASYVVADIPEALWSNLGLTYLAHTHVPTIWSKQQIELPRQEWTVGENGQLSSERRLPNGIVFQAQVEPRADGVRMKLTLHNGTAEPLSDLRVQQCVMLKGAAGFNAQTNDNKWFQPPYAACESADGGRWIITGWTPSQRVWGNAPCPCLHADPQFPDCPPGESRVVRGWLSFYEGNDLDAELARLDGLGWREED